MNTTSNFANQIMEIWLYTYIFDIIYFSWHSYNLSRLFRDSFVCLQDIETFDLEDFKYNSVNMTAFRLVDLEEAKVAETLRQMERFQPIGHAILNKTGVIQVGRNFKLKVKKRRKNLPTFLWS